MNLPFDFTVSGIGWKLKEAGWILTKVFFGNDISYLKYKKDNRVIVFLDLFNYIKSSVAQIGKLLGKEKITIDFNLCTDNELIEYCKRDVEIIKDMMLLFIEFITAHNLGSLGITISACAFNSFRHRFMKHDIFIHNHESTLKLERDSYFGGRCECFYIGEYRQPMFILDINSMYPFVMRYMEYPVRLFKYQDRGMSVGFLQDYLEEHCVIAEVLLKTPEPVYPFRLKNKTVFPVGKFKTVLTTASLKHAIQHGHIQQIKRYAIYDKAIIFDDYVDFFYRLKRHYQDTGNDVFQKISKLFLNSLYGKFGQHAQDIKYVGYDPKTIPVKIEVFTDNGDMLGYQINVCGDIFMLFSHKGEGFNSFTAIASHVTDYARMYLWQLIQKAGKRNVLYIDTDSLFVNNKGYVKLAPLIDHTEIGGLRLLDSSKQITIYGLKDYEINGLRKIKGVKKDAERINDTTFKQIHFPSLIGVINEGLNPVVKLNYVTKTLTREYEKGIITSSGFVKPYSLNSK